MEAEGKQGWLDLGLPECAACPVLSCLPPRLKPLSTLHRDTCLLLRHLNSLVIIVHDHFHLYLFVVVLYIFAGRGITVGRSSPGPARLNRRTTALQLPCAGLPPLPRNRIAAESLHCATHVAGDLCTVQHSSRAGAAFDFNNSSVLVSAAWVTPPC